MKIISSCALVLALLGLFVDSSLAQDQHFNIVRFEIEGNTLLPQAQVGAIVAPFVGPRRVYGDIQKALEALERAYRAAGYGTVQVYVPEQELTTGVVRLQVTEGVIGKVVISGNKYFNDANIRASLPSLKEGKAPNLRQMSENIQLANANPAKQVGVTLGMSEAEGKIDAKVAVTEEDPQRFFVTVDNTGTAATGRTREGIAYQNANLFNRDQTLTLAYTGSVDAPTGVRVDIYSLGYRVPFYALGDSLDFIYGNSNVNTPSASPTLGGMLGIVGKGDVFGLRWNHNFARRGEYSSKLIYGLDYKYINSTCTVAGAPYGNDPLNPILGCVPYTTRPFSLTYTGQKQSPGQIFDYNIGLAHNFALGSQYANPDGGMDRYSFLSGNRTTRDDFNVLRLGGSYLKAFRSDWQARVALNGQYSGDPLVAAEQLSLAGSTAVRGFEERAVTADSGYVVNAELYTPELIKKGSDLRGSLRALAFYDVGRGYNQNVPAGSLTPARVSIASVGAGLRYALRKDVSLRFDLAQVVDGGPVGTKEHGDWRGHVNLMLAF